MSSESRRPSGWSTFGDRWIVEVPYVTWISTDFEYELEVDFDPATEQPVCTRLEIRKKDGGPNVDQDALRVPISEWVSLDSESIRRPNGDEYEMPAPDRFTRDPSPDDLDEFCDLWTWLRLRGEPAGAVIAAKYGVRPPTTSRWIARARKLGILDDTHQEP